MNSVPLSSTPWIVNDIVVLGLIAATLGVIFWSANSAIPLFRKFYRVVPALLLCYFVPAIYNTTGLIDGVNSALYDPVARDVLLPAALTLLTLSIDIKSIVRLGPKLLLVFAAGTFGIMLGAVVTFELFAVLRPQTVSGDTWAGMAALAGSWIGGGANMVAMREVFEVDATVFGQFAVVDVAVANLWMATLLFLANRAHAIDQRSGADTRALEDLQRRLHDFQKQNARIPEFVDLMTIIALGLGVVGVAHALAHPIAAWFAMHIPGADRLSLTNAFVWVVVLSTSLGVALSFTRARRLEGVGASRVGSIFLYFLIACIGMQMDLLKLLDNMWLFLLGVVWMAVHVLVLWLVARVLKAPLFYFAIGSQGNIGAAASAPVVAAAFHPALAPVGALLGTIGYATGTYLAYLTGVILNYLASA